MSNYAMQPARTDTTKIEPNSLEAVLVLGDLAKLTPYQRVQYYYRRCEDVGLNPYSQPFIYITLSGKLTLYATKTAADQLRANRGISLEIVGQDEIEGVYVVRVRAKTPDGRVDEDAGTVPIAALKGEARGNAILKAITKAKRRVTLSICGLGMLDETEVETIPGRKVAPEAQAEITAALSQKAEVVEAEVVAPGISEEEYLRLREAAEAKSMNLGNVLGACGGDPNDQRGMTRSQYEAAQKLVEMR